MLVYEFDGIFDRYDMARTVVVTVTDHGGKRGRLARAGRADENDQSALCHGQILDDGREGQLFDRWNLGFDPPQHHATVISLVEGADTETTYSCGADCKIALVLLIELMPLISGHHAQNHLTGLLGRECGFRNRLYSAVDLHAGRHTGGDKQIGSTLVDQELEKR